MGINWLNLRGLEIRPSTFVLIKSFEMSNFSWANRCLAPLRVLVTYPVHLQELHDKVQLEDPVSRTLEKTQQFSNFQVF